jgi:D-Tyr-tRNAtyr deacylase
MKERETEIKNLKEEIRQYTVFKDEKNKLEKMISDMGHQNSFLKEELE